MIPDQVGEHVVEQLAKNPDLLDKLRDRLESDDLVLGDEPNDPGAVESGMGPIT